MFLVVVSFPQFVQLSLNRFGVFSLTAPKFSFLVKLNLCRKLICRIVKKGQKQIEWQISFFRPSSLMDG